MMLATTIPFKRRNTSRGNSLIAVSLITAPDHTSCTAVLAMTGKHAELRKVNPLQPLVRLDGANCAELFGILEAESFRSVAQEVVRTLGITRE
jgi:hypothetical protein